MKSRKNSRGSHCRSRRRRRAALVIETLESRRLLAAYALQQLTDTGENYYSAETSISDNGSRISVISNADLAGNGEQQPQLYVYDVWGKKYDQITSGPGIGRHSEIDLSGNGDRVAFTSSSNYAGGNADGNVELFLYDISDQRFTQLTSTIATASETNVPRSPSINANGTRVAFGNDVLSAQLPTRNTILIVDTAAAPPVLRVVTQQGRNPSLSADGNRIAFESSADLEGRGKNADGNQEIFLYDISQQSVRQITDTQDAINLDPAISGNGQRVAMLSGKRFAVAVPYVYDDDGGGLTKVGTIPASNIEISGDGERVSFVQASQGSPLFVHDLPTSRSEVIIFGSSSLPLPGEPGFPDPQLISISLSQNGHQVAFAINHNNKQLPELPGPNPELNYEMFLARVVGPPSVVDDTITTEEDTKAEINVLDNDFDPAGLPLQVVVVTNGQHGRVTFNHDGRIFYLPDDEFIGTDSFTYGVENSRGIRTTGTVYVTVESVNDAPEIIAPDSATLNEDERLVFSDAGDPVQIRDIDAGAAQMDVAIVATHGVIRLGDTTGLQGGGSGGTRELSGRLEDINRALAGLSYLPDADYFGPASLDITVTDFGRTGDGVSRLTDTHRIEITVVPVNDPPVITQVQNQSAEFGNLGEGEEASITVGWSDGDPTDLFTATVDWGDGHADTSSSAAGATSISQNHPYEVGGIFTITVTVTDGGGLQSEQQTTAVVSGVGLHSGVLQVIGTTARDKVHVSMKRGKVVVKANYLSHAGRGRFRSFDLDSVDEILAYLGEGNDRMLIAPSVPIPAIIHGGDGNDFLTAGRGGAVLLGDAGNDVLLGGRSRDILIGGLGRDLLLGGRGQDVLVGGTTIADGDDDVLRSVFADWSGDGPYETRVAAVESQLDAVDDGAHDFLFGGLGRDFNLGRS